jgi:two-component system, chemotaxis family, chemotaxis protein CheY
MHACLLVDDSRVVRKVMGQIIQPLGFVVHEAENGAEALQVLQSHTINVVMLDWNMPLMNGLECLQKLRAHASMHQPKVIFCTTENEMEKIQQALDAGADEYVMKPFDADIIRGKFEQLGLL